MTEHAVVIAGGSPTGLMLALARVDVAIVERRPNQDLAGARASRFSTKLSMQRTYYARVGALLPQSGVHGRPFARGR